MQEIPNWNCCTAAQALALSTQDHRLPNLYRFLKPAIEVKNA
jgi:hypothetical protein